MGSPLLHCFDSDAEPLVWMRHMASGLPLAKAADRLRSLDIQLADHEGFSEALSALDQGQPATFDGVYGSGCALVTAGISRHRKAGGKGPTVLVMADAELMDDLADDLQTFTAATVSRFPPSQATNQREFALDEAYGSRIRVLKQLLRGDSDAILVTCIQALMQKSPSAETLLGTSKRFRIGDSLDIESFPAWLVENGFHHTSAVELPGEFSIRGGIVDVFAYDWHRPIRIELFDDEIESIRQFDVQSQRTVLNLDETELTVLSNRYVLDDHLSSCLPSDSWIAWHEPQRIDEQGAHLLSLTETPETLHGLDIVRQSLSQFATLTISDLTAGSLGVTCRLNTESVEQFQGDLDELRSRLDRVGEQGDVHVVARTDGEVERVHEILQTTQVATQGRLKLSVGCVHRGFRLLRENVTVIGCDQLFHRGELRRLPKRRLGKAIDSFLDLRQGDLVVHLAHGIARYRGLKIITKQGYAEEHLELEFAKGTKVFVPVTRIDLIQKYIGGTKTRPRLGQIGGKTWIRQKKAAEQAVTDMAADMLHLTAERMSRPGIAFAGDTQWQYEFENAFPYNETTDQLHAIEASKTDMQTARPMDRLICGDVGFGKTEVAMRAAFKAVENGYQVAVLVPTTVLAEQHYRTFKERMAEFPLEIAKLSRFGTTQEQKKVVAELKSGRVDIVVGTHRLASKDVSFFNLGLVIVDEEQRFGVEIKERLKSARNNVDVLTLSATPIPRTLHMSLVGVRDISNLESPPEDRLNVETRVTRWSDELIRHAFLRELNRNGQIYFVHNRVGDIGVVQDRLKRIVPEARIVVGHAQMPEGKLEKVMRDFIDHKFDVLLATTIIESDLDIPNANTIFIDEADRYGLADMHQLRGRVGRYKHQAYAYLLIDSHKHVNPTAAKRLRAIEEYSQMGAGFAIAMRDLEIRGAGNLLGTEQSGHIAAVGYELYCQLLESAVRSLKKMPAKLALHVDIDLPIEAFLPDEYIPEPRQKIDLYRRLTRVESYDQLAQLHEEMLDRFGPLPPPVSRLLVLSERRLDAAVWQVESVFLDDAFLVLKSSHGPRLAQLKNASKWPIRIVDEHSAYLRLTEEGRSPEHLLDLLKSILHPSR